MLTAQLEWPGLGWALGSGRVGGREDLCEEHSGFVCKLILSLSPCNSHPHVGLEAPPPPLPIHQTSALGPP